MKHVKYYKVTLRHVGKGKMPFELRYKSVNVVTENGFDEAVKIAMVVIQDDNYEAVDINVEDVVIAG